MRFGVEDNLCQRQEVRGREEEVQILQSLGLFAPLLGRHFSLNFPPCNSPAKSFPYRLFLWAGSC